MCAVNGIFAYHDAANPIDCDELLRTRDQMAPRGPDGAGKWISDDGRVGLGNRRLSIIDLSDSGAQPMTSADGKLVVTFNGEIYNHRELRRDLKARGHVFLSQSDTEVLLHLYAIKGEQMVHDLRGMFAFGIWDVERRRLFLARDQYGIKPLYYANDGKTFRFASQVKALLHGRGVSDGADDPAGWVGFYLFGSVPEPFTTYQAISALPAGTILRIDRKGECCVERYHSIAAVFKDGESYLKTPRTDRERQALVRDALLDSVRHHLVADVPVGAFLSSGIDSGALVGLMRDASQNEIETVTLAFEEFRGNADDEVPLAAEVAHTYCTRHTTRLVTKEEFRSDIPALLAAMDQPTIDGVNTWFVSKAAHELGLKVAISGVGGDELFGGYPSFRDIPRWVRWFAWPATVPHLGATLRQVADAVGTVRMGLNPKIPGLVEYGGDFSDAWLLRRGLFMPWELERALDPELVREGLRRLDPRRTIAAMLEPRPSSSFAKVATLESALYMRNQLLRDTDWASMAHSLEVRTPLVDAILLRRIAEVGPMSVRGLAKQELAFAPSMPLPAAVVGRKKTGFVVPVGPWSFDGSASQPRSANLSARRWARYITESWGRGHLLLPGGSTCFGR